jgi:DNA modification methylase
MDAWMRISPPKLVTGLREVVSFGGRVKGARHSFYKYPARFSPVFARTFIAQLTKPGEWVLDPFMGGGTSVVESLAAGRPIVGSDLSSLAHFIATARTTPLSKEDGSAINKWVRDNHRTRQVTMDIAKVRNVPRGTELFFANALYGLTKLERPRQRRFARMVLLRLGQWAIEREQPIEDHQSLCTKCVELYEELLSGLEDLVSEAATCGIAKSQLTRWRRLQHSAAVTLGDHSKLQDLRGKIKLVITSPPYPGVHVLYHRWQIRGRKETAAPFWLADVPDGQPESFYTFGGRKQPPGFDRYYQTLFESFKSIRTLLDRNALVAQLVAFSEPETQLDRFTDTMRAAGFRETRVADIESRASREVPNRRWYAALRPKTASGKEFLLLHEPI